jgi:hypothetical protein
VRRFVLLRDAPVRRAFGWAALLVLGLPLGIALTLAMMFLFYGMMTLRVRGDTSGIFKAVSAIITGVVTAVALIMGAVQTGGRLRRLKKPCGTVTIGLDGVLVKEDETVDLVRWSDVADVRHSERASCVTLELEGGKKRDLVIAQPSQFAREARKARDRAAELSGRQRLSVLSLGSDDQSQWLTRVKEATRAEGYRDEPVTEEALVAVLEDPAQSADQRLGAALALAHSEVYRPRVRVAAETTVEPDLAEALEEVSNGEVNEPTLRRALARK